MSFALLPAELVRKVYEHAGDSSFDSYYRPKPDDIHCNMSVADRLRGAAVCKAWQAALEGLPLCCLSHWSEQRCHWVIKTRPAVLNVHFPKSGALADPLSAAAAKLLPAVMAAVQPKVLEDVRFDCTTSYQEPILALPRPGVLSNLTRLQLGGFSGYCVWDTKWVASLSALRQLRRLDMKMAKANGPLPLIMPALPSLTNLDLSVPGGLWALTDGITLRIDLAGLPRLQVLKLLGDGWAEVVCSGSSSSVSTELQGARGKGKGKGRRAAGRPAAAVPSKAAAAAPAPTPALQELYLHGGDAVVDFGAMPNLRVAWLQPDEGIIGASTLARATALEVLQLGGDEDNSDGTAENFKQGWVEEALRAAPPSLCALGMYGEFHPGAIKALAGLPQLRVLSLLALGKVHLSLEALHGDGWRNLRALRWICNVPLPKELREASKLEMMWLWTDQPEHAVELVPSLPALRCLQLSQSDESLQSTNAARVIRQKMPHLQGAPWVGTWKEFMRVVKPLLED